MPSDRLRKVYDSQRWRKVRQAVLKRDGHHCRWPGCHRSKAAGFTMTVDHINPIGGEVMSNLITLCQFHHGRKDGGRGVRRRW